MAALLLEAPLSLAADRPQRTHAYYEPNSDVLEVVIRPELKATATVAFQDLILAHVATEGDGHVVSSLTFIGFRAMRDSLRAQVCEPVPSYDQAVGLMRSLGCKPVLLRERPDAWPPAGTWQSPVASFMVSAPPQVIHGLLLVDESHRGPHIAHPVSPRLEAIAGESGEIVGLLARGSLLSDSAIGLEKAALEDLLDLVYGSFFPKEDVAPLEQKVRSWAMARILSPLFVVLEHLLGAPVRD